MELRGNHSFLFWVKQKQSCKKVYGVGSTQPCLPAETCHSFLPHGIQVSISSAFHSSWCSAFLSTLNSVRPFTLMTLLPGIARICGLSLVIKEPLTHRSINTQIKYMCDPYRPNPSTSTTCYEKGMVLSYMADKWFSMCDSISLVTWPWQAPSPLLAFVFSSANLCATL